MELFLVILFLAIGIFIFFAIQLVAILFLLSENKKIGEELEKNSPPF